MFEKGFTEAKGEEDSSGVCQETHPEWDWDSDSDYDDTEDLSEIKSGRSTHGVTLPPPPPPPNLSHTDASLPTSRSSVVVEAEAGDHEPSGVATAMDLNSNDPNPLQGKKVVHIHDFS